MSDLAIVDQFKDAMSKVGITPPEHIEANGKLHRFSTNSKRNDTAGYYVLHLDGIAAGAFGCWRAGINQTWCSYDYKTLSQAEKEEYGLRITQIRVERDKDEKERYEQARQRANQIWEKSNEVTMHPYLTRKQIKAYGIREYKRSLVVPICDDGVVHSLQFIKADGSKRFLMGGRKKGCYFVIEAAADIICICEGYATAVSVYEAIGYMTVVAFDSGNLLSVGKAIRTKFPEAKLVFCADDDAFVEGNPGLIKGKESALAVGGYIAIPNFGDGRMSEHKDFNDLHRTTGLENVKSQIDSAVKVEKKDLKKKSKRKGNIEEDGNQPDKLDAKMILALVKSQALLFHDKTGNAYACVKVGDKPLNILIESQMFEDWICRVCWISFKTALKNNLLKDCIATLRAEACFDGPCYAVFTRIGFDESNIYLDLTDDKGLLVKINAQGWEVINNSPIKFIRTSSMQPLVKPESGGNVNHLFYFIIAVS